MLKPSSAWCGARRIVENHKSSSGLIWNKVFRQLPRIGALLLAGGLLAGAAQAAQATQAGEVTDGQAVVNAGTLTVGILAPRGTAHALAQWRSTLDALERAIPRARFEPRALTLDGITRAVASGEVDFVLTNPGQFVMLGTPYALSWLATLRSKAAGSAREALGSVLLVRADAPYTRVQQLTGERVVAVHPQAFGGYLLLLPRLEAAGIGAGDVDLEFLGYPVDALAYQLRDGQAEAAILPVCMLEQMATEGLVREEAFRALLPAPDLGGCLASTPAYPDWTFAALPHVSEPLTGDVARVLLAMDAPDTARWGAPVSAARVATLFDDLQLHPLREPLLERLAAALTRYWHYTAFAVLLVIAALLYHAWVQHQAYRHARALEATQLALRDRERALATQQNRNISGELAATLAHEINQPLAAIRHYAEGGLLRLERQSPDSPLREPLERIGTEAGRGADIIEQARNWIRQARPSLEALAVAPLFESAIDMARHRLERHGIDIWPEVTPPELVIKANRLALEQVLGNLIGNSLDAFAAVGTSGWIALRAAPATTSDSDESGRVQIIVEDNAGGFDEKRLAQPFAPLESSRDDGLGLGLVICRRLIRRHGGELTLANHPAGGARVTIDLPTDKS